MLNQEFLLPQLLSQSWIYSQRPNEQHQGSHPWLYQELSQIWGDCVPSEISSVKGSRKQRLFKQGLIPWSAIGPQWKKKEPRLQHSELPLTANICSVYPLFVFLITGFDIALCFHVQTEVFPENYTQLHGLWRLYPCPFSSEYKENVFALCWEF